jgi:RNA polymerase sigma factor (sigma-70 family)
MNFADLDIFIADLASVSANPERYERHVVAALANGASLDSAINLATKLDVRETRVVNRMSLELERYEKERYDKGWVPGPNAHWQKRSPDEMANELKANPKAESQPPLAAPTKPLAQLSPDELQSAPTKERPEMPQPPAQASNPPLKKVGLTPNQIRESKRGKRGTSADATLREIIKGMGGISVKSLNDLGLDTSILTKESGLSNIFRANGGKSLEDIAQIMHDEGHIVIPGVQYHGDDHGAREGGRQKTLPNEAGQYVLDQLQAGYKSMQANLDKEYEASYQKYLESQHAAEQLGASPASVEESRRRGEEAGNAAPEEDEDGSDLGSVADEGKGTGEDVGDFPFGGEENPSGEPGVDSPEPESAPTMNDSHPDQMANTLSLYSGLPQAKAPDGAQVPEVALKAAYGFKSQLPDIDEAAQDANIAIYNALAEGKYDPGQGPLDKWAATVASNALKDKLRREGSGIQGKTRQFGETEEGKSEADTIPGRESSSDQDELMAETDKAIDELPDERTQKIMRGLLAEKKKGDLATELGISNAMVTKLYQQGLEQIRQIVHSKHSYEYGPRHQPHKRIDGAVARLEALRDCAADIDEEALAEEIDDIAREFMLDEFKEICRAFGIKSGLRTKTAAVMLVFDRVKRKVHKFSSTQFDINGSVAKKIIELGSQIPDEELAKDGREENPHITVKYGIHADNDREVSKLVKGFGPIKVKLGKTFIFPAKDKDYDVVNVEVESKDLHRLNKLISESVECTDTHPSYVPHVCIAYVKAGTGQKYAGNDALEGTELTFNEMAFSDKERKKTDLPLSERKAA